MKIYNTMARMKEELVPLTPGEIKMYSCGVTVYDLSHVGHARMLMVFDVIARYLRFAGFRVTFVRNFTDIDDKIIRRANQEGIPARELSERNIAAFEQDMAALGVLPPDIEPRATEHLPEMIGLIERLIARGYAYVVDGDVYFEVRRFPAYGKLSGKNLDELQVGARVEVDERKRDPRDFALWKSAKPGEPAWESPWGPGRPGWHIECSAMSVRYLGESFDIHGGGEDLIFPHHECEVAQTEADTGKPFARYWVHNGMVNMGREKMSKSLGNTLTIRDLVSRHDPAALRLFLLGTHYRSPLEWAEERVADSARAWSDSGVRSTTRPSMRRLPRPRTSPCRRSSRPTVGGSSTRWTTTSTRRRPSAPCSTSVERFARRGSARRRSCGARRSSRRWPAPWACRGHGAAGSTRRRSTGSSRSGRRPDASATSSGPTRFVPRSTGSERSWRTRRRVPSGGGRDGERRARLGS
jgi:cysteinyl-tRNA synthetase